VTALAVDTTDTSGQTLFLCSAAGGVWRTTTGGTSWISLTDTQPSLAVGSIAIDPNNHNNIYVGTGEENFNGDAYFGAGVLKSTDGETWSFRSYKIDYSRQRNYFPTRFEFWRTTPVQNETHHAHQGIDESKCA